jgi:hypothetical protein
MDTKNEHINIKTTELSLSNGNITQLTVLISGSPSIREIMSLMKRINEETDKIKQRYISVTDLSKLDVGNLFRSIIIYGMEKTYKSFLAVKNRAIISFVIINDQEKTGRSMMDSLKEINNSNDDYAYKYLFINNIDQVKPIVEKILSK